MGLDIRRREGTDRRLRLEQLEERRVLAADFELLVDATSTPERGGSNPTQLTVVGDVAYFVASTPTTGAELWKTDGAAEGTVLVKDIRGGRVGSDPTKLTNVNGTLFFVANDSTHGAELWATDGTSAGTRMLTNLPAINQSSAFTDLIVAGDLAYFIAPTPNGRSGLWKSDGTAAGTTLIKEIGYSSIDTSSKSLIECNGALYFIGNDGLHGAELWKSDGTADGTAMVRDIYPGSLPGLSVSPWSQLPATLVKVGGIIYFAASDSAFKEFELWRSDGTTDGTAQVRDIYPGYTGSNPQHLTEFDGKLIFVANDGLNGLELWTSDGTTAGTTLLKNIAPVGLSAFTASAPWLAADSPHFTKHDGLLYFVANESITKELWRTDGASAGTLKASGVVSAPSIFKDFSLTSVDGSLYFIGPDGGAYASDGTAAGTTLLKQFSNTPFIPSIPGFPKLGSFTQLGDRLLLVGATAESGSELWSTDGTPEGTVLLKDIVSGNGSSSPAAPVEFGGALYITAGGKLWTSDGKAATPIVLTSPQGETLSGVSDLNALGDAMYFTATSSETGRELWRTDGTPAGTTLVKDTRPGATSGSFNFLKRVGEKLYFNDGNLQLWESDGTEAGTKPIATAQNGSSDHLAAYQGALYFPAEVDDGGQELWRVDGNGAVLLKDFTTDDRGGEPQDFIEFNGLLYFTAHDGTWYRRDLWKTDGTPEGTTRAVDVSGAGRSNMSNLTLLRGELYFTMSDDQSVASLWKTDGTEAGTTRIKTINPSPGGFTAGDIVEAGGLLYFMADDGVNGFELWRSDGTAEGTIRLTDALPGVAPSFPTTLTNVYGTLYFSAYDEVHGEELWKSDGTPEGTGLVKDFAPGDAGSAIRWIRGYRGGVMVAATTPEYGQEIWAVMPESRGDYTGDGVTDGADFLAWQRGYGGSMATPGDGADGNEDGAVDAADLAVWLHGFGTVAEESFDSAADDMVAALAVESWDDLALSELADSNLSSVAASGRPIATASVAALADEAFFWLAAERVGAQEESQAPLAVWEEEASFALARAGAVARVGNPLRGDGGDFAPLLRAPLAVGDANGPEEAERALPALNVGLDSSLRSE